MASISDPLQPSGASPRLRAIVGTLFVIIGVVGVLVMLGSAFNVMITR